MIEFKTFFTKSLLICIKNASGLNLLKPKTMIYVVFLTITIILTSLRIVPASPNLAHTSFSKSLYNVNEPNDQSYTAYFASIQEAVNNAPAGSTIIVPSGTYYEHVIINKTVSLIAEEKFAAVIDGSGSGTIIEVTAHNVKINGFTLQNSGYGWTRHGIYIYKADNCTIENNHLFKNCHNIRLNYSQNSTIKANIINGIMTQPTMYGIRIENSINCTATGNQISDCVGAVHLQNATDCTVMKNLVYQNSQGIRFYTPCVRNEIFENTFCNNSYDGMITTMPTNITLADNKVFHNNFVNNSSPFIGTITGITWDDGYPSGGNHWSRHNGTDRNSGIFQNETGYDGVGDTYYHISQTEKDRYPLMHPYGSIINTAIEKVFLTIKSALSSPQTLEGHKIIVKKGVYYEHITINKSVSLIGENQSDTTIDGEGFGTVITLKANNTTLAGFTIRNSGLLYPPYGNDCGLLLDHSSNNNISYNIFENNRIGVYLFFSRSNILVNNILHSNIENGMWLWHSGNNTLKGNSLTNNTYNFGVFGNNFEDFDNKIDASNKINDKPIRYVVNDANTVFDESEEISVLYLINCVNITTQNLKFVETGQGVFCFNVNGSSFQNLTVSRNNYGLDFLRSNNNTVISNICENNWVGIRLENSANNTVKSNLLVNCEKGISLYDANMNYLEGNTFRDNIFGLRLSTSNSNHIYRNNFILNDAQVDLINSHQNCWDDSVEGNYWSNCQGADDDKNGIVDHEYLIDANNRDCQPLSGICHILEVEDGEEVYEVVVITNSTIHNASFESSNRTLVLTVEGSNGTLGFCRLCVPYDLIKPELNVIIDHGHTQVTYSNYNLMDNGICRWIYFEYVHSVHEIIIISEFQWPNSILLIMTSTIALILFKLRCKTRF